MEKEIIWDIVFSCIEVLYVCMYECGVKRDVLIVTVYYYTLFKSTDVKQNRITFITM